MTSPATVFLVDDDPVVTSALKAMLAQHGYQVASFNSAEAFLDQVNLQTPGCLVTDIQMPGMTGAQLQSRLVATESVLSIVVVTGVADVPLTVKMMQNGAVTLLEKPYDPIDLLAAVERGLRNSHHQAELAEKRATARQRIELLTAEEQLVLRLMIQGVPNKTISKSTGLSMRTVDRRRQAVVDKMQVKTVPELAAYLASVGIKAEQLGEDP